MYRGISDCLYKVYIHEGPKGLFRGLGASLGGIVPYAGVDLSVFFTLKETWLAKNPEETPGVLILLAMGATSSFCGQITALVILQVIFFSVKYCTYFFFKKKTKDIHFN